MKDWNNSMSEEVGMKMTKETVLKHLCLVLLIVLLACSIPFGSFIPVDKASGADGEFGGGSGTLNDPYIIEDVWDLQAMKDDLTAHYVLGNDINASATTTWNSGAGFVPVGNLSNRFTGSLDGKGYNITGLYISRSWTHYVGLFGYIENGSVIENTNNIHFYIDGRDHVGGLVGYNNGTMADCFASGNISGSLSIGGLIGSNWFGTVTNCSTTGKILGSTSVVGGLIGSNWFGTVTNCSATGNTNGFNSVGGLVGANSRTLTNCSATGNTNGTLGYVGGLVGHNDGTVTNCSATGNTNGTQDIGGLVGFSYNGSVTDSYAMVTVTGSSGPDTFFGGFVGRNSQSRILRCYSTGSVICSHAADPTDKGFAGYVETGGNYEMTSNFWDMETSGQNSTAGSAMGLSTVDMMKKDTFANTGWDIEHLRYHTFENWYVDEGVAADAGPDLAIDSGEIVTFDGSNSTDVGCYAADYPRFGWEKKLEKPPEMNHTWSFNDDGHVVLYGVAPTYRFMNDGIFNVTLNLTNSEGLWSIDDMTVYVGDAKLPVADAGPDQLVNEGDTVKFNGSASFDNVEVVKFIWIFDDSTGTVVLFGGAPSHTFKVPGIYVVTLNIINVAGYWATDTMTVTVIDITPPVADAGLDQVVDEGDYVTFDGTGSSDNVGVVNWTWTFNDGMSDTVLERSSPSHIFHIPGIYIVTLNVTDAAGHWNMNTMTVCFGHHSSCCGCRMGSDH